MKVDIYIKDDSDLSKRIQKESQRFGMSIASYVQYAFDEFADHASIRVPLVLNPSLQSWTREQNSWLMELIEKRK